MLSCLPHFLPYSLPEDTDLDGFIQWTPLFLDCQLDSAPLGIPDSWGRAEVVAWEEPLFFLNGLSYIILVGLSSSSFQ